MDMSVYIVCRHVCVVLRVDMNIETWVDSDEEMCVDLGVDVVRGNVCRDWCRHECGHVLRYRCGWVCRYWCIDMLLDVC